MDEITEKRKYPTLEEAKQQGYAGAKRAARHVRKADPEWMREATWAQGYLAIKRVDFIVEEIFTTLGVRNPPAGTTKKAAGNATADLARRGFIEKTGEYRRATTSAGSEKPVWRLVPFMADELKEYIQGMRPAYLDHLFKKAS